jgi:hypothetical protein
MLHFVQHDTTADFDHRTDSFVLSEICVFTGDIPILLVAALPREFLCGEFQFLTIALSSDRLRVRLS